MAGELVEAGSWEHAPPGQALSLLLAGVPWLRVGASSETEGATRIDLGDPRGVALTLDPLEPEAGFPVATHASLLSDMWCAAGQLPGSARDLMTLGLLRAYEACGWDIDIGGPLSGATVPTIHQVAEATEAAAEELRCDDTTSMLVRGFMRVRLGELCGHGSGMFFTGGHRLDVAALTSGNVEVITDALDHTGRALVAGTLLLRLTERARLRPAPADASPRHVLAIDDGQTLLGGALDGLIADAASYGEVVLMSAWTPPLETRTVQLDLIAKRRSTACGRVCRAHGPCTRHQIRVGTRLADSELLRAWAEALVVAFVAGRMLPAVPVRVLAQWAACEPRLRECALATIVDEVIATRAPVLREVYQPSRLATVVAGTATALLEGGSVPQRAGQCWVPPVLRWVHEAARVGWTDLAEAEHDNERPDADEMAPPLDFAIGGLADWPGIRARQRLALLLRHPLSAELPHNRRIAARILGGGTGASG